MRLIDEIAGELCKVLLPIEDKVYFGNPDSNMALCTLSSMNQLREVVNSQLMVRFNVAGRLLSENKGVDILVRHVLSNKKIDTIILCGKEVIGHKAGHSLICLYKNGIDKDKRIIGSQSPNPFVSLTEKEISMFQAQVTIIDKMGETNISQICSEL